MISIDKAWREYMEIALWSSTNDRDEPLDAIYSQDDIVAESRLDMLVDLVGFIAGCVAERPDIFKGIDESQIGQDFWLTRNRHGAGFWDRGLEERGDWLTAMAKPYGNAYLFVGDDGKLHHYS